MFHRGANRRDHLRAQSQVPLQAGAAEVDPAVAQAERLVDALLVELEGQRRAGREDLEAVDLQLYLAGRDPRVDVLGCARDDLALGAQDELVPDLMGGRGCLGRALRVDHELADAGRVAQVDEHEPAVVAPPRDPPRQRVPLPHVLLAQLARARVAPAHHLSLSTSSAVGTSSSGSPDRRIFERSGPHSTTAFAPSRPACVSWPLSDLPA